MGWDENAFAWLYKKVTNYREKQNPSLKFLEDEAAKNSLETFASLIAGRPLQIIAVKDQGGFDGITLLLPESFSFTASPQQIYSFYLFKILFLIYLGQQKILNIEVVKQIESLYPAFISLKDQVFSDWTMILGVPLMTDIDFCSHPKCVVLFGENKSFQNLSVPMETDFCEKRDLNKLSNPNESDDIFGRATEIKKVNLNKLENENPLTHSFEKVHTLDQYAGGFKTQDGTDDLLEHGDALKDLQMDTVSISTESVESILRTQALDTNLVWTEAVSPVEMSGKTIEYFYPEWDHQKVKYKKYWCQLYETTNEKTEEIRLTAEWKQFVVNEGKKQIAKIVDFLTGLKNERSWKKRQREGEDIDIDSVQDLIVSIKANLTPDDRVYKSKIPSGRDWVVLILLDQSLSTESWLGDEQIIDIEKKGAYILGESLNKLGVQWGLASFYSKTRKEVHFHWIKHWRSALEDWQKLFSLNPQGATRLGPILRHAIYKLKNERQKKKMLLFLSDTKPTDFDYYEGSYGTKDFAKAIFEARQAGIHLHVASIQDQTQKNGHRFFRTNEYSTVSHAHDFYRSITAWLGLLFRV